MSRETEIGTGPDHFRSTHWTNVLLAKDPISPGRREAQERLIRTYWKPVYFLVRRRGRDVEAAKDLTQAFFAAFLERDFLQYVDRSRGRFRIFLRTALNHFLADEHERATAQKRGGASRTFTIDFSDAEAEFGQEQTREEDPERLFLRKWAVAVMKQALEALRAEYEASGQLKEFEALRLHLSGQAREAPSYAELARVLDISPTDVANRLHRARKKYREAIVREVRACTETDADADEEVRDLFSAFTA